MIGLKLPFFDELEPARRILIAGAGGGFDVFSGLPLYFALRDSGRQVFLGNLSFSTLRPAAGRRLMPNLVEITADSLGSDSYFPEKHLCQWFRDRGDDVPIYCFERTGPRPVASAYEVLVRELKVDTVILVDGGTDSLMRGDEQGLGTPVEDVSSISAVDLLDPADVPRKLLVTLGFGIDAFHGVSHAQVLEAIAALTESGGYLGAFSLMPQMSEVRRYREATEYVLAKTESHPSIVCTSILSAIEGKFGNHQRTTRTAGSELFINPLMALYWCFRLETVARRILYLTAFRKIDGFLQAQEYIETFRDPFRSRLRPWKPIPF
ncbi:MAG TPA: DUF1152 domain-containing protein [Tepidisphaeraceae bacterium]|jgi:hypothetical protein